MQNFSTFSGASLVAQMVKRLPTMQEIRVRSLGQEDPLEKYWSEPTPVLLPGKSHGPRSLVGYRPRGCKASTQIPSDVQTRDQNLSF